MLIINADDWGRSQKETDAALACFLKGRITSVSAMVFMEDSARAASLAKEHGLDVGLHLNLSQRYQRWDVAPHIIEAQDRIVRFMTASKYALLVYHPGLRRAFQDVYKSQLDEFVRLYGTMPSHVDGHQHKHLCANMVFEVIIPTGQRVRRNFSFWPGEKSAVNRAYRRFLDRWLERRYRMTNYFFSLEQCLQRKHVDVVIKLAVGLNVELMTHPFNKDEYAWLMGNEHPIFIRSDIMAPYLAL